MTTLTSIAPSNLIKVYKAVLFVRQWRTHATEDVGIARKLHESEEVIRQSFDVHMCPLAGLGKLAQGLHHKLNALLHQLRLETETQDSMRELLCSIVSMTTDQGVENSLIEVPDVSLRPFFPEASGETAIMDIEWDSDEGESSPQRGMGI